MGAFYNAFAITQWGTLACRACSAGVWPDYVERHMKRHTRNKQCIEKILEKVDGLHYQLVKPSEWQAPLDTPLQCRELPLETGYQCICALESCYKVVKSHRKIMQHVRDSHRRTFDTYTSQDGQVRREGVLYKVVACQRVMTHGPGSSYFAVTPDSPTISQDTLQDGWRHFSQQSQQLQRQDEEVQGQRVESKEAGEVNMWVESTGWQGYLHGLERARLLQLVQRPKSDSREWIVCQAIRSLAQKAQHNMVHCSSRMVKLQAVMTERNQVRHRPLQPYQDDNLAGKTLPWEGMLLFFFRCPPGGRPAYKWTEEQAQAWKDLQQQLDKEIEDPLSNTKDSPSLDGYDSDQESLGEYLEEMEEEEEVEEGEDERGNPFRRMACTWAQQKAIPLTPLEQSVLNFCISLLDQQTKFHEYESALVCASAVIAVTPRGWQEASNYTPLLSKVIKIARYFVIQASISHSTGLEGGDGIGKMASLDEVAYCMESYMVRNTSGPIDWFLNLRSLGFKISYTDTQVGHVQWTENGTLLWKQLSLSLSNLRSWIHGMVSQLEHLLHQEVLLGITLPSLRVKQLKDDHSNKTPFWSFLQDPRNQEGRPDPKTWMMEQIQDMPKLQAQFLKSDGTFNQARGQTYLHKVERFLECLLVVFHCCSGGPSRAPNIVGIKHQNTPGQGMRNIFLEDGYVFWVTRDHKGYSSSGKYKTIARYCPMLISQWVVEYFWLAQYYVQAVERAVYGPERPSVYLWADRDKKPWKGKRLGNALRKQSQVATGQAIGTRAWRDIIIAYIRRFLKVPEGGYNDGVSEVVADDVLDGQAAHSTHTAEAVYAREAGELGGLLASAKADFRIASLGCHQLLQLDDPKGSMHFPTQKRTQLSKEAQAQRWTILQSTDAEAGLAAVILGPLQFRSVQRESLQAVLQGETVMSVMPTSAGKSLLFLSPARLAPHGCTIVVVPLLALRYDLQQRCQKLQIGCSEFDPLRPKVTSIVLVTPEGACSPAFQRFLNRLHASHQLDRIVIDECHTVLSSNSVFRKKVQLLPQLLRVGAQMVLLTATLPPHLEGEVLQKLGLAQADVIRCRGVTRRANIRYSVIYLQSSPQGQGWLEEMVVPFIQNKWDDCQQGRGVVYCQTIGEVQQLSSLLGVSGYHSAAPLKELMLQSFMQGPRGLIVSTSALGMGVDIPDIRWVIHVRPPRNLLDYGQESGRAGRDGVMAEAIILNQPSREPSYSQTGDQLGKQALWGYFQDGCRRAVLQQYLDGHANQCEEGEELCDWCQRKAQAVEAERASKKRAQSGSQLQRRFEFQKRQRLMDYQAHLGEIQIQSQDLLELQVQIKEMGSSCLVCQVVAPKDGSDHSTRDCPSPEYQAIQEQAYQLKKMVRFQAYTACYICGLPQGYCKGWVQEGQGEFQYRRNGCEVGLLGFILYVTLVQKVPLLWQLIQKERSVEPFGKEHIQWLGEGCVVGEVQCSRFALQLAMLSKKR